jgi:hypothetical protein
MVRGFASGDPRGRDRTASQGAPSPSGHSIWELIFHIESWVKMTLGAVDGVAIPVAGDGRGVGLASGDRHECCGMETLGRSFSFTTLGWLKRSTASGMSAFARRFPAGRTISTVCSRERSSTRPITRVRFQC